MTIAKTGEAGLLKSGSIFRRQIFIPIAALLALVLFNLITDPSFFEINYSLNSAGDPVLSGYLITILDNASELAILAIGMTLVTAASGGQDISVGAAIAISGSVVLRVLCGDNPRPEEMQASILTAFLVSCVVSMLFGAFNGTLVAYFNIQPMIATLILYTAGRSIAAWINNNRLPIISDPSFGYFGSFLPGIPIPTPIFIAIICMIIIALVLFNLITDPSFFEINYSGIHKVHHICDHGPLRRCRRIHQSHQVLYDQLLGRCSRYRDGCDSCGRTWRECAFWRQVQHGLIDSRCVCNTVPYDNTLQVQCLIQRASGL